MEHQRHLLSAVQINTRRKCHVLKISEHLKETSHRRQGRAGWGRRVWWRLLWWQWRGRSPRERGRPGGGPGEGRLVLESERLKGGQRGEKWRLSSFITLLIITPASSSSLHRSQQKPRGRSQPSWFGKRLKTKVKLPKSLDTSSCWMLHLTVLYKGYGGVKGGRCSSAPEPQQKK